MKHGFKLLLLFLLLLTAAFANARNYYDKIYKLTSSANKADYTEAEKKISDIVANHNTDPNVYSARSGFYYKIGKEKLAIQDISKAIELVPEKYGFYELRCELYLTYDRFDEALKDINTMFSMDSTIPDPYIYKADYYFETDNLHAAFANYDTAIRIYEGNHAPCNLISHSYGRRVKLNLAFGKPEKAIQDLTQIIKRTKDRRNASNYTFRALAYSIKGDTSKMYRDIDSSIALKPDSNLLIYLYALRNDTLNVNRIISGYAFRERTPTEKPSDKQYSIACYYAVSNQKEKAIKYLEESLISGYKSFNWMKTDYNLNNIRNTPEFAALIEKYDHR